MTEEEEKQWREREKQLLIENNRLLELSREKTIEIEKLQNHITILENQCSIEELKEIHDDYCIYSGIKSRSGKYIVRWSTSCGKERSPFNYDVDCQFCNKPIKKINDVEKCKCRICS
jgi:hypothetical protein